MEPTDQDWLEQLAEQRRREDSTYAEIEARIEAETGVVWVVEPADMAEDDFEMVRRPPA